MTVKLTINWVKDRYEAEKREFERTAKEFSDGDPKAIKENIKFLKSAYQKSSVVKLIPTNWSKMTNTDSWKTDTFAKIRNAFIRNNEYRDLSRLSEQFADGKVSAPIAIKLGSGKLYLIAGNTRLMMCKALKINPNIVIINSDW